MEKAKEEMKSEIIQGVKEMTAEVKEEEDRWSRGLSVKPLTFDGQTSWTVFKTHFNVVSSTNGWTDFVKAGQLVAYLQGSAAEILQGSPADKLTDLTNIKKVTESRFGDSHLTQFYRTELKIRRQNPGKNLQMLAANMERLMSLAYTECPLDVRERLVA
ncbi:transposon Ty3-G Gag-Pol polyprotein [Nephila pilipes]|uniref:Transposon Ty3-G Gag-Pol polyprotein n=1 Tax=Nephila pilipes TaxID=299642 RepID=A0A8X6NIT0_NEPPI|nr:transposon Ty3-G Gag-Pol polyprotein [Nephila pilipes]